VKRCSPRGATLTQRRPARRWPSSKHQRRRRHRRGGLAGGSRATMSSPRGRITANLYPWLNLAQRGFEPVSSPAARGGVLFSSTTFAPHRRPTRPPPVTLRFVLIRQGGSATISTNPWHLCREKGRSSFSSMPSRPQACWPLTPGTPSISRGRWPHGCWTRRGPASSGSAATWWTRLHLRGRRLATALVRPLDFARIDFTSDRTPAAGRAHSERRPAHWPGSSLSLLLTSA